LAEIPGDLIQEVQRAGQEDHPVASKPAWLSVRKKEKREVLAAREVDFAGETETVGWRPGDRVEHKMFGTGTVVSTRGEGEDAIITVAFPGAGIKDLAVRYAPLKKGVRILSAKYP
jgi:hypothetical protein